MTAVSHIAARIALVEARQHHADFIAAAEQACGLRDDSRAQRSAARRAGAAAAVAAEDVPALAELVGELLAEVEDAHQHKFAVYHDALSYAAQAFAAEEQVVTLSAQVTQLQAALDQANAALRDREVAP